MQSTSTNGSSRRSRHATVSWRHALLRIICRQRAAFRSRHSASARGLSLSFSARTGSLPCDLACGVREHRFGLLAQSSIEMADLIRSGVPSQDPTTLFDTVLTSVYIAYTDRYPHA